MEEVTVKLAEELGRIPTDTSPSDAGNKGLRAALSTLAEMNRHIEALVESISASSVPAIKETMNIRHVLLGMIADYASDPDPA